MKRVSDACNFSLEDINKVEEKKSSASSDCSDTTIDLHSNCGRPRSNETNTQPVVILYQKSEQESTEPIYDISISLAQQDHSTIGINEVLEEEEMPNLLHREKKLKTTELSDLSATLVDTSGLTSSFLDQLVEFGLKTCCSESVQKINKTAEDGISVKIAENKFMDENLDSCSGFQLSSLNNDCEMLNANSNGSTSRNHGTRMLTPTLQAPRMQNDTVHNAEFAEIHDNKYVGVAAVEGFSTVSPLLEDNKEASSSATNIVAGENRKSSDADKHEINLLLEIDDKANETINRVEEECKNVVGEKTGNALCFSGDELLGGDTQLCYKEQSTVSDADNIMKQLEDLIGPTSQAVGESINLTVTGTFSGYSRKKLLVLDVNGLLVDISPYVPYDYDPDDIINRRAVFRRPYCDNFLAFCFERFNVGVWSSRTKRNMEPILDFIFGNDKQKLAFCWCFYLMKLLELNILNDAMHIGSQRKRPLCIITRDQSHCTDSGFTTVEKRYKPLLLKKLKKLWEKCEPDLPWEKGEYNETNTLLLDDTPCKSLTNPQYNAIFPRTYRFTDVTRDRSLGPGGDLRVYLEGLSMAENVQEYVKQNSFGQRAITDNNLSWCYYLKVIEASSTPPRQNEEEDLDKSTA